MNPKVLKTIEYTKIIAMLLEEAESSLGKERAEALLPSSDFCEVERNLLETEEAESRIRVKGPISFRGIADIRPYFSRLQLGASLSISELYQVTRMLENGKRVK